VQAWLGSKNPAVRQCEDGRFTASCPLRVARRDCGPVSEKLQVAHRIRIPAAAYARRRYGACPLIARHFPNDVSLGDRYNCSTQRPVRLPVHSPPSSRLPYDTTRWRDRIGTEDPSQESRAPSPTVGTGNPEQWLPLPVAVATPDAAIDESLQLVACSPIDDSVSFRPRAGRLSEGSAPKQ
jgi:hypothetical protein